MMIKIEIGNRRARPQAKTDISCTTRMECDVYPQQQQQLIIFIGFSYSSHVPISSLYSRNVIHWMPLNSEYVGSTAMPHATANHTHLNTSNWQHYLWGDNHYLKCRQRAVERASNEAYAFHAHTQRSGASASASGEYVMEILCAMNPIRLCQLLSIQNSILYSFSIRFIWPAIHVYQFAVCAECVCWNTFEFASERISMHGRRWRIGITHLPKGYQLPTSHCHVFPPTPLFYPAALCIVRNRKFRFCKTLSQIVVQQE